MLAVALLTLAGCKKKQPPPPAATAPAVTAPAPTAELSASPSVISAGDQTTLSWRTSNATTVTIEGIGSVPTAGVRTVTPGTTTTYHLVATGPGGTANATASVTVNGPPAVSVPSSNMTAEEEFKANVQPIFFDYDTAAIRPDAQATLQKNADYLIAHPNINIVIGGYCDQRGSEEYNLALGQRRAQAAKNALITMGVAASRMQTISYGKERLFCTQSTEQCWQLNRRDGFKLAQ
jgi:peptidoglycan-associated lipoprotein